MFYYGLERPPGIFDDFFNHLEIPVIESSASFLDPRRIPLQVRSQSIPSPLAPISARKT
jgi:hypothetical protein